MGFCSAEALAFRCTAREEEIRKTPRSTARLAISLQFRLVRAKWLQRGNQRKEDRTPPLPPYANLSSVCPLLAWVSRVSQSCFDILVPPATDNRPSFRPNEFCSETRNLESYFHIWNLIFSRNMCILKNKCQKNRKSHEPTGEFDWIRSHRRIGGERGFILLLGASHGRRSRSGGRRCPGPPCTRQPRFPPNECPCGVQQRRGETCSSPRKTPSTLRAAAPLPSRRTRGRNLARTPARTGGAPRGLPRAGRTGTRRCCGDVAAVCEAWSIRRSGTCGRWDGALALLFFYPFGPHYLSRTWSAVKVSKRGQSSRQAVHSHRNQYLPARVLCRSGKLRLVNIGP